MDAMDRFVTRENIERYRKLASQTTDPIERSRIMKFLADEVAKIKLELRRRGEAPEGRSAVNAATEKRVEDERKGAANWWLAAGLRQAHKISLSVHAPLI